jgi:hypothetical protein
MNTATSSNESIKPIPNKVGRVKQALSAVGLSKTTIESMRPVWAQVELEKDAKNLEVLANTTSEEWREKALITANQASKWPKGGGDYSVLIAEATLYATLSVSTALGHEGRSTTTQGDAEIQVAESIPQPPINPSI